MGTILLIDDEPIHLDVLKKVLEKAGFSVLTTRTGGLSDGGKDPDSALAIIQKTPIAVAIVDLMLGDEDGIELFKRMHAQHPLMRGIACSAYLDFSAMTSVLEAGFDDCLSKPVNHELLVESCDQLLTRHNRMRSRLLELHHIDHEDNKRHEQARENNVESDS